MCKSDAGGKQDVCRSNNRTNAPLCEFLENGLVILRALLVQDL